MHWKRFTASQVRCHARWFRNCLGRRVRFWADWSGVVRTVARPLLSAIQPPAMLDATAPLPFHSEDLQLLPLEAVAAQLRTSCAFVRLCLAAGCGTRAGGLLSAAELLHWLFDHSAEVRALAGLAPLPAVEDVSPGAAARLRMANALFTLFEFGASRASGLVEKQQLLGVCEQLDRALDRS